MLKRLSQIGEAGRRRTFLLSLCFILIGLTIVGYDGTRLVFQQLAYHSYKVDKQRSKIIEPTISRTKTHTPFTTRSHRANVKAFSFAVSYPTVPKLGDSLGELDLPELNVALPIVEGAHPDQLAKGVGHFHRSVLPGEDDNCVLSGHRDTVFRHLDELKIGDDVVVKTKAGTFVYTIKKIRIVDSSDRTVIVPTLRPTLTLTTCYPFHFIGNAPKRYIVTALLQPAKSQVNIS